MKRFAPFQQGLRRARAGALAVMMMIGFPRVVQAQVYVANSLGSPGTVSVISSVTNTVVGTIPVQSLPHGVAITPNGQFVYVTNQNSGTMSKIDTSSNTVITNISVGSSPRGVAVSPDGNSVFVVTSSSLVRVSVATNAVTGNFPLPSGTPFDVAITPSNLLAYVVDQNQNVCSLYPLVLATGVILNNSTDCPGLTGAVGGSFPRAVAVRPDGQFVYVTAFSDSAIQSIRTSDNFRTGGGCVIGPSPTFGCSPGGPDGVAISSDSKFAFTANSTQSSVSIFALDQASGFPTAAPILVPLPSNPRKLDVTPDGRFLYVTHGDKFVSVVDLAAAPPSVIKTIEVGSSPIGIAVSPLASGPPPPPPPPGPPALGASLVASPDTVTVGQAFTVTMTVNNTGGSAASGVTPSPLTPSGTGGATQTFGPSPSSATIGAGASQQFTFTYSASAAGNITFSGNASGGGVSSPLATSNTVTIQSSPSPPTLSVAPGSLSFIGELGFADPAPQSLQVANGGGGTFAWSATSAIIGGGNWLSISPVVGSAPPDASLSVGANTCGLPVAIYNGSVIVSADGASGTPTSTPVTLFVTKQATAPPSPLARVCADRPSYRTGDVLRVSVSLRQGVSSNTGDAYLFAPVPGTTTFVSLVLSGGILVPQLGPAPVPLGVSFQVSDFAGAVFERSFDGFEPAGTYEIKAILALPGTDPAVVANQLAVGTAAFAFAP